MMAKMMEEREWTSERLRNLPSHLSTASRMRELALATKGVIKLTSGEPDFATPTHIREAAKKAMDEGYTYYTSSRGIPEFREAVAEKMKRDYGLDIDSESEIIATTGGKEAIFIAIMGLIDPGDEVLIPDPGYLGYEDNVSLVQGRPVSLRLFEEKGFAPEPSDVIEKISSETKMIIVNSPSNPTGAVFEKSLLRAMAEIADDYNLFLLSDDAYEKFVYDNAKCYNIMQFGKKERKIIVGSFSKTYAMTGWRIGYLIADAKIIKALTKIKSSISISTCGFIQKAAIAALNGPQKWPEMVKEFDKRRRFLVTQLNAIDDVNCPMPRGAFFAFPNISNFGLNSVKFANFLLKEAKVAVYPGIAYGNQGEGHVRFTYAASMENLKRAVEGMRRCVRALL